MYIATYQQYAIQNLKIWKCNVIGKAQGAQGSINFLLGWPYQRKGLFKSGQINRAYNYQSEREGMAPINELNAEKGLRKRKKVNLELTI